MQNDQLQNKLSVENHDPFYENNKSRALSNFYVITLWIIYTIIEYKLLKEIGLQMLM